MQRFRFGSLAGFLWLALFLLTPHAQATWSIVVIDRKTGEVGITSATCIENLDLRRFLPVIVVGKGAAAAQSFIDAGGSNRQQIQLALEAGYPPERILQMLGGTDSGHQTRQYGIVSRTGPPLTFTGTGAGEARFGVVGSIGDYDYAIQGNVLTGDEVVLAAETAFRTTPGDMAERMMAAMESARALGGDGRCSCAPSTPTACGVPPANFTHSAFIGFFMIARPGDIDGLCNGSVGCATGDYYVNLNVQGNASTLDPVLELRNQFDAWRASLLGIPDHFMSTVDLPSEVLVADGSDALNALVTLRDVQGQPVTQGVQGLEITQASGGAISAAPTITSQGNGQYQVTWTATQLPGQASYRLRAQLANQEVIELGPEIRLTSRPDAALVLGRARYATQAGTVLPIRLRVPGGAGCPYRLLATASGTTPGTLFQGITMPLNADGLYAFTLQANGSAPFDGSVGTLDAQGHGLATLALPPGRLLPWVGRSLTFSAAVQCSQGGFATETASILIEW